MDKTIYVVLTYSVILHDVKFEKSNAIIERNIKSFGIDLF